jgi:peroxin-12
VNPSFGQGQGYVVEKEGYGICPLCKKEWQNPAVLPSGWVVCWRCGWEAVEGNDEEDGEDEEEHQERLEEEGSEGASRGGTATRRRGRCPITGVEVAPGQLRRVLV